MTEGHQRGLRPRAALRMRRTPDAPEDLQFGGTQFKAASDFLRRHRSARSGWRRLAPSSRDPAGLAALVRLVRRLPRVSLALTDTPPGRRIRDHLDVRVFNLVPKHRIAQGILLVPASPADYAQGRSRRALRNNLARAARTGVACRCVVDPADRREVVARWTEGNTRRLPEDRLWSDLWARRCPEPGRVWSVAVSPTGGVVGLAVMTLDTECAMLEVLVGADHGARWLLQAHVAGVLSSARVRYLFTESGNALTLKPELQYLQQILGYRVANLAPTAAGHDVAGGILGRARRLRMSRAARAPRTSG